MIARIRAAPKFILALPKFILALSLVAEVGGRPVGHLLISRDKLRLEGGQPTDQEGLMLGPISVLPDAQRRGVGSRLMRRGLDTAASRPELVVVLIGHPEYYPRFGFRPAREFGLHPDWDAAMVYPLWPDLSAYRELHLPEQSVCRCNAWRKPLQADHSQPL